MILLKDKEIKSYENKRHVIYVKDGFVITKINKANLNFIIKSEIIGTTPANFEELLIIFAI